MRESEDARTGAPQPGSVGILEAVLEGTPDAIFVKDLDGRYLMVNSSCARFIGKPKEQIIGSRDEELYPPETACRFVEADRRIFETGRTQVFEGEATARDGAMQSFRVTKGVVRDSAGHVVGLFGISHDMTERRRAEEERLRRAREQAARAEAEESSRMKDLFLATLSHELRTPLTAIYGWASMIDDMALEEATVRKGIKIIRRNAEQQRHIIEDIFDASGIITGKLRVETCPVDLAQVACAAVDAVRPLVASKGVRLSCDFGSLSAVVMGDPYRLQQVVWNLLSNAVKFTPSGGEVTVEVERLPDRLRLTVSDTGPGISPDFLPHIFERFRQADNSSARTHGGLGLGLALVKHLVELHGGSVGAQSGGNGSGAAFTVDLPPAPVARSEMPVTVEEPERREVESPSRALDGLRVLLVDDHEDTLQLLSMFLRGQGAQVTAVNSAARALERLTQARPDVLISDVGMPGGDGYELMRKIRNSASERDRRTPAVALTAYASDDDRRLAFDAGFDAHLAKPFEPATLVAMLAGLTGKVKTNKTDGKLGEA